MSRRYPPGRRYALPGSDQSCASCEHWQINPDSLATGRCCYRSADAPKRYPFTMEAHVCDKHTPRLSSLAELAIGGVL